MHSLNAEGQPLLQQVHGWIGSKSQQAVPMCPGPTVLVAALLQWDFGGEIECRDCGKERLEGEVWRKLSRRSLPRMRHSMGQRMEVLTAGFVNLLVV